MNDIAVDIRKTLRDGRRSFTLSARFESRDDFVVLFGPSGSGKSLTLQAIAGLVTPDAGTIRVGGRNLYDIASRTNCPIRERGVGYVFQDYALFPHLTVAQNVGLALSPWGQASLTPQQRLQVDETLEVFELSRQSHALPRDLSGGQRQRSALARALVRKPDLLLLDEPFAALNPLLRARMRSELLRIQAHFQVPVLLITHDQDDVEMFGDTLVMYDHGAVRRIFPFKQYAREKPGRVAVENLLGELDASSALADATSASPVPPTPAGLPSRSRGRAGLAMTGPQRIDA
ncbi:MAG TPA: ATP-binding cassette domain-containing protein [Rhodocyclaceae bacterium]|nr:ATP-binding cassette domain-containing protein [Rhodocyclaceae bacterium]HNH12443.1 ATP-binding cassette domain-containing protein [Rhodocyclaceae bacterium]